MRSGLVIAIVEVLLLCSVSSCQSQDLEGCTDPLANNYDPLAEINDGSCTYDPVSISPQQTYTLNDQLERTSGLILWDGNLWTHNDHADTVLYGLDISTADIERTYALTGVKNADWEDISQDEDYIYIGDFGNNNGNRTDLHVLRIMKNSLLDENPIIDTIWFSYEDQTDFSLQEAYQTDFDCEAMIVSSDSIYLFTKQWISAQTSVYRVPKTPGIFTAIKKDTYDVQGLITGATYLESERLLVLCGYTTLLQPFLTLLYGFQGHDFFFGNKRRITISLPFHQIEGIATQNGLNYYISNESFSLQPVTYTPQRLHKFDLSSFLEEYLTNLASNLENKQLNDEVLIYPIPVNNHIIVKIDKELSPSVYKIYDQLGRIFAEGTLVGARFEIDIGHLAPGLFTMSIGGDSKRVFRILKYH